jgi:hypothetical protein
MADALVILLLVAAHEGSDPATLSVTEATRHALGSDSVILVNEVDQPPTDEEVVALERRVQAGAVVALQWEDAAHTHARLRMHAAERWTERGIEFGEGDPLSERGRTIGFAVASMLPPRDAPPPPNVSTPPVSERPPAREAPPPAPLRIPQALEPSIDERAWTLAIEADAALGPHTWLLGPRFDVSRRIYGRLGLRANMAARLGSLPAADASIRWFAFGAGGFMVVFHAARTGVDLQLAADLAATRLDLFRAKASEEIERQGRWFPTARLLLEAGVPIGRAFVLNAAIGSEAALGTTEVVIAGTNVVTVTPWSLLATFGGSARF